MFTMKLLQYQMKRFVLCILTLCVFAVGCHRGERNISDDGVVKIETRCDSALYVCYANSAMGSDTFGVEKRYCIAWPENAPAELYDEILRLAFRDSIGDFDVTTEHFLDDLMPDLVAQKDVLKICLIDGVFDFIDVAKH